MKRSNQFSLGEAIRDFLEAYDLEDKLLEKEVIGYWEEVVGAVINKHTRKVWIKNRKLYARVDSPVVRNELTYSREKIRQALNRMIKKELIVEIVIR